MQGPGRIRHLSKREMNFQPTLLYILGSIESRLQHIEVVWL